MCLTSFSPSAFEPEKAGLLLNLRLQPQALAHCLELAHRLYFPCYVRDRRRDWADCLDENKQKGEMKTRSRLPLILIGMGPPRLRL